MRLTGRIRRSDRVCSSTRSILSDLKMKLAPRFGMGLIGASSLNSSHQWSVSERPRSSFLLVMGHEVIFYPKFHCELNFIERFWCSAKHYARENCSYSLEGLRETVPRSLHSVAPVTVNNYFNHCNRTIDGTCLWRSRVYQFSVLHS